MPGQRLKFPELCFSYEASVGVLREALTRLAEQGLVQSVARQGFQVTPLSVDDLTELTDVRIEIESLVLRRAIAEGDLAWESTVVAAHHTLERTPISPDEDLSRVSDAFVEAHERFHSALLDGCASRRLRLIAVALRDEAELYRRWSLPLGNPLDRDIASEHRALRDAALAHDAAAAVVALRAHITRTADVLLAAERVEQQEHTPRTRSQRASRRGQKSPKPA